MRKMRRDFKTYSTTLWLLLMGGCAVGPNFMPEPNLTQTQYTENPVPTTMTAANDVQQYALNMPLVQNWWEMFECDALNQLVELALCQNPTLQEAVAKLEVVRDIYKMQAGVTYFPQIDGSASFSRQQFNSQVIGLPNIVNPPVFNLYNVGTNVSYIFDLFGGNRRRLETIAATIDYQAYQTAASQVTLAANVVTATIQMAAFHEQILLTETVLAQQNRQLNILEKQLSVGGVSQSMLLKKQEQISETKANLAQLKKQHAEARHQIAVYLGESPATICIPNILLSDLKLPPVLPMSFPSEFLQQRADVQAANALMHAACALIGVATAEMFPKIQISGNLSSYSMTLNNLFGPHTSAWNIGAGLTQPIFHGGELRAQREAAIALYGVALANYHEKVLNAIQNVADTLKAIEYDSEALHARADAVIQNEKDLHIVLRQHQVGGVSLMQLLDSEQAFLQAKLSSIPAQATRLSNTAALCQALGGGWWDQEHCLATSVTTAAMLSATD